MSPLYLIDVARGRAINLCWRVVGRWIKCAIYDKGDGDKCQGVLHKKKLPTSMVGSVASSYTFCLS